MAPWVCGIYILHTIFLFNKQYTQTVSVSKVIKRAENSDEKKRD